MTGSGEIAKAKPKGKAKTLRQKDRVMTILCRSGFATPKVQPHFYGNLSGTFSAEAHECLKASICAPFLYVN